VAGGAGPGVRSDKASSVNRDTTRLIPPIVSAYPVEPQYHQQMSRQEVLSTLRAQQATLHARFGVARLSLFGSVARDEAGQDSDVDLLVEFDRPIGLFRFLELQNHLEDLLRCGVDLGTPQSLKPRIRDRILAEAVRVV
jgi:predicted nucleotidyltransferase